MFFHVFLYFRKKLFRHANFRLVIYIIFLFVAVVIWKWFSFRFNSSLLCTLVVLFINACNIKWICIFPSIVQGIEVRSIGLWLYRTVSFFAKSISCVKHKYLFHFSCLTIWWTIFFLKKFPFFLIFSLAFLPLLSKNVIYRDFINKMHTSHFTMRAHSFPVVCAIVEYILSVLL